MPAWNELLGFAGTAMILGAYVPQMTHIVREHCSGGVSTRSWTLWLVATVCILFHAAAMRASWSRQPSPKTCMAFDGVARVRCGSESAQSFMCRLPMVAVCFPSRQTSVVRGILWRSHSWRTHT